MNHLGQTSVSCFNYASNESEQWVFRICELGGVVFVEFEVTSYPQGCGQPKKKAALVEFRQGHQRAELHGETRQTPTDTTALADLISRALDFKKNEDGVWIPKVKPGDALILDKPGAPEFRVFSIEDQAFEKVPKKALEVHDTPCTCPFTQLVSTGCSCGGRRLKPGLREIVKEAS